MRMLPVASLGLALLLLSGCLPQSPTVTPTPQPSSTPVFASDEEALAAAEAAYRAFQKTSDEILAEGGTRPERIDAFAVGAAADTEKEGFADFVRKGYRSTGLTTFDNFSLEAFDPLAAEGRDIVRAYLCSDVSGVNVVDLTGTSVVAPDRPTKTAFEVGFDLRPPLLLVVSSKDVWDGGGVCP
ncbi:MAG: hypothetical protein JWP19_1773 [Rhodoglobus sp.]|nr:hypothetical protein [Rhodoglobus sp.]